MVDEKLFYDREFLLRELPNRICLIWSQNLIYPPDLRIEPRTELCFNLKAGYACLTHANMFEDLVPSREENTFKHDACVAFKNRDQNKHRLDIVKFAYIAEVREITPRRRNVKPYIFVENSGHAGKTVGDVQKCPAAQKAKTKDLPIQITLMYIKIENPEAIMKELIKGMDHKNPKIVATYVAATRLALKEFDSKKE
uniref:XMAP215/Dis1/CLASP TOG domain-containing protein n=1 Tax=Glossina brevipalpis TaxID=37001 RepID=A0A1A9X0U3_9MUSC